MAGMVDQLIEILSEQTQRYEELLGLALEKRDIIIADDLEGLQKINHLENLVVSQNSKLERKRQELVADMALVLNQKEEELTINRIIELIKGQDGEEKLAAIRDKIKAVAVELHEANLHNGELVQNALDYLEYTTNLIHSSAAQQAGAFYNAGSSAYETLPDDSGYFDARN
jgi:flagellar biosynthesis/type III secretory pathway chaperone